MQEGGQPEAEHGFDSFRVVRPEHPAAQCERLLQLLPSLRVQPEVVVRLPDGLANLGFHLRLLCEFAFDALGRAVQGSPYLQVRVRFCLRPGLFVCAGLGQQIVLQKIHYGLRGRSLGLGTYLRSPRPNRLPRADHNAYDQCQKHRKGSRYQHLVAPRELPQLIARARRLGRDGPVFQITPDISRQLRRRSVTPGFVFLQRLGGDGLDIPAIRAVNRT